MAEELDGKLGGEHTQELPLAEKEQRLKAVFERIHREQPTRSALCLSGGGIRSATFGLGILQGLAACGLLNKFHYLSTVSGGGYIGSWLSAWIKNHPEGIDGVVAELAESARTNESLTNTPHSEGGVVAESPELKRLPDSVLNPDPRPIRHLRKFSNYLAPKTGLTSVDFWTLVTTFIRNMFLNWLVLISLLGAVMMIPRFYLVATTLAPNWAELASLHTQYLNAHPGLQPDWAKWADSVKQHWDIGLTILLAVGFVLIAIAMAYAIIDVPSTGNARLPQSRFLKFRQLPLLLASLILAAWWAVFRNVHGSEPFQPGEWLLKFVGFSVAAYLSGGVLAWVSLSFRKPEQKSRPGRFIDSVLRLSTIVLTAAFAGFCLWAMAMRLFLFPSETEFVLNRDCEPIQIANQEKPFWNQTPPYPSFKLPAGTRCFKTNGSAACPESDLPGASLAENEFVLKEDCKPVEIQEIADYLQTPEMILAYPRGQKATIPACTHVRFAGENLTALQPVLVPAPAQHALNYVCFAPALILGVLMLVNFLFTGLASKVTEDEDREWWGRSAAWILITIFGWIVFNVIVLWGAQTITATTTGNQLQVFFGQVKANPTAKAVLGAFGGVSGIAGALLALRSKLGKKLGQKRGFQWLLVMVAVAFFLLLSVVISWALLVISSRSGVQKTTIWFLPWDVGSTWHGERLFVISFLTGITLLFGIVMAFFLTRTHFPSTRYIATG